MKVRSLVIAATFVAMVFGICLESEACGRRRARRGCCCCCYVAPTCSTQATVGNGTTGGGSTTNGAGTTNNGNGTGGAQRPVNRNANQKPQEVPEFLQDDRA